MKGIMLGDNNDLQVVNGHLVIGERKMQDVYLILKSNQGEFKEDPVLGANLLRNIRMKAKKEKIKSDIEKAILRVGINIDDVSEYIKSYINKEDIDLY